MFGWGEMEGEEEGKLSIENDGKETNLRAAENAIGYYQIWWGKFLRRAKHILVIQED